MLYLSKGNSSYKLTFEDGIYRSQNNLKLKSEKYFLQTGKKRKIVVDITFRDIQEVDLGNIREKDKQALLKMYTEINKDNKENESEEEIINKTKRNKKIKK